MTEDPTMIVKSVDRAMDYGYRITKVVLRYATSYWVWKPNVIHFGFVRSEEIALRLCDTHLKRSMGWIDETS